MALLLCLLSASAQDTITLRGEVTGPRNGPLPGVSVRVLATGEAVTQTLSNADGTFAFHLPKPGEYILAVQAPGMQPVSSTVSLRVGENPPVRLQVTQIAAQITDITVTADINAFDVLSPDPGERVFVREDLLNANPGRPGGPVSLPGYPIETASSGIKAPQYFAPGVAGDHGEPIAQYIAVGSYLLPNNLSANAHGNGYADPNVFIPEILQSVEVNSGAFNASGRPSSPRTRASAQAA